MGTSSQFGGASTGLVPDWVDKPSPAPAQSPEGTEQSKNPLPNGTSQQGVPTARVKSLRGAKGAYTGYLKAGGPNNLRAALRSYGKAIGGSSEATRRMGTSRSAAAGLIRFVGALGTGGTRQALQIFNLSDYADKTASDILFALAEVICPPGGTVDEGIARDAMQETINELIESGVVDLDKMTDAQREELLVSFIAQSIHGRILNDIGHGTVKLPFSNDQVERLERALIDYIRGHAKASVEKHFEEKASFNDKEISVIVDGIYQESFSLLMELAETLK